MNPARSPFREAFASMSQLVLEPLPQGNMATIFYHLNGIDDPLEDMSQFISSARAKLLSMACQVHWRFLGLYETFPFKLVKLIDPLATPFEREQCAREFLSSKTCCLDEAFSAKAQRLFTCSEQPSMQLLSEQLLSDTGFLDMLRGWNDCARITNMHIERLLVRVRKSTGATQSPNVDHLCAGGFLSAWLHEHACAGGMKPGVARAEDLIKADVPLARNKDFGSGQATDRRMVPPQFLYASDYVREVKKQRGSTTLTRQEYRDIFNEGIMKFSEEPENEQQVFKLRAETTIRRISCRWNGFVVS